MRTSAGGCQLKSWAHLNLILGLGGNDRSAVKFERLEKQTFGFDLDANWSICRPVDRYNPD